MNKWYLAKLLTNTAGQDGSSISVYSGDNAENNVLVAYDQTLAAFHNAEDVLFAVVEILNENGYVIQSEIVDHRPPEPEPEPETEE